MNYRFALVVLLSSCIACDVGAGTAVFVGASDQAPLVAGYARDRLVQQERGYRFENGYKDWYDHIHGPAGYLATWPKFRPEYQGDIHPRLARKIGTADFEISVTLDPRSAPLGHPGG